MIAQERKADLFVYTFAYPFLNFFFFLIDCSNSMAKHPGEAKFVCMSVEAADQLNFEDQFFSFCLLERDNL